MKKNRNCLFFYKFFDKFVFILSIILLLILILCIYVFFFVKFMFNTRYSGLVYKDGGDYYVSLFIDDSGIKKIQDNILVAFKRQCDYDIIDISSEYVSYDKVPLRRVNIRFDLPETARIINNVIDLNFVYKSTFYSILKEKFL